MPDDNRRWPWASTQKPCGEPQAEGSSGASPARRPCGARESGQPSRWARSWENRKRCAAIQPMDWSMARAREEVRCRRGCRQRRQSHTERGGLLPKAAYPELPALIRRRGLPRRLRSSGEGVAMEQAGPQKQRDHGEAEPQPRQRELRQQRNRTLTQTAQVAAHADHAIKGGVHERAAIETVAGQWLFGLALRAMVRAVAVWIRDRLCILLDRTVEWM